MNSLLFENLATFYPDARFIAIIRDVEAVVASSVARNTGFANASSQKRKQLIVRIMISWAYYNKTLELFNKRSDRMLILEYQKISSDITAALDSVCTFLGLPFEDKMCKQQFKPNTSFKDTGRKEVLTESERTLIRCTKPLLNILPLWLFSAMGNLRKKKRCSLPWWFFKLHSFNEKIKNQTESSKGASTSEDSQAGVSNG
jgi:hypothetical protein